MCHPTPTRPALHQTISNGGPAKALGPSQRLTLGLQALAGNQTITDLADELDVSRKFVYRQAATAQVALEEAFAPQVADDQVLFYLPVTEAWPLTASRSLARDSKTCSVARSSSGPASTSG